MDSGQDTEDLLPKSRTFPRKIVQYLRDEYDPYDIIINVENRSFHLHKEVLSASLPYFKAMFTNELLESRRRIVTLYDIDQDAMEIIVDLAYSVTTLAQLNISDSNVQSLLAASTFLNIEQVKIECCDYMQRNLDPSNCVGIRFIADRYSCRDLFNCAKAFTIDNFEEVVKYEEFLGLSVETFIEIISKDALNVKFEETVCEAVIKWAASSNHGESSIHISTLMRHVRWSQIDTAYLVVHSEDLNKYAAWIPVDTIRMSEFGIEGHLLYLAYKSQATWKPRLRHRLGNIKSCEKLYVVTGSHIHRYDPKRYEWIKLATEPYVGGRINECEMVASKNELYFINRDSISRYNPFKNEYNEDIKPPDPSGRREDAAFATLKGLLYFIGGRYSSQIHARKFGSNLVDRYDPVNNTWKSCARLMEVRYKSKATALDGYIYVIGGANRGLAVTSVERYDPRHDEWRFVGSWNSWCPNFGCTSSNGYMYIMGEGLRFERYDPRNDLWETIPNLGFSGYNFPKSCLAAIDGLIYTSNRDGLTVYDPDEKRWYLSAWRPYNLVSSMTVM